MVDERRIVLGVVSTDGETTGPATTVEEAMDPAPVTVRADVGVDELPDYASSPRSGPRVVTTPEGVLIGTVTSEP